MVKLVFFTLVVVFVLLAGGGAFLSVWDIPVHTSPVEKVLPDARFPK